MIFETHNNARHPLHRLDTKQNYTLSRLSIVSYLEVVLRNGRLLAVTPGHLDGHLNAVQIGGIDLAHRTHCHIRQMSKIRPVEHSVPRVPRWHSSCKKQVNARHVEKRIETVLHSTMGDVVALFGVISTD